MNRASISERLQDLYSGPNERVGFIVNDEIVEVDNISQDPQNSFLVGAEDVLRYEEIATATWHTHPNEDANLSVGDYETFQNFPDMTHFIVGRDGVRVYEIVDGRLLCVGGSTSTEV